MAHIKKGKGAKGGLKIKKNCSEEVGFIEAVDNNIERVIQNMRTGCAWGIPAGCPIRDPIVPRYLFTAGRKPFSPPIGATEKSGFQADRR